MSDITIKLIELVLWVFSLSVHESFHAIAADKFGDSTAKDQGRITLNPIPHIDLFATIILPLIAGIGAAKPVPVDFENLKPKKLGMVMVSVAGPLSNFALAIIFVLLLKVPFVTGLWQTVVVRGVVLNLTLGIFNLVPIPPLDGSKIWVAFAPEEWKEKILQFERWGFLVLIALVYLGAINFLIMPVFKFMLKLLSMLL